MVDAEPKVVERKAASNRAADGRPIKGRSLGQIAWMRLKRDKAALAGGIVVLFLILVAIFAPVIVHFFGHDPNEFHQNDVLLNADRGYIPRGRFGGMSR